MTRSRQPDYDVIVVGSGPAGISTAMHLTRCMPSIGKRMIVLERASHPRKKICGGGIGAYADIWLKRLDITLSIPSLELNRLRIIVDHDKHTEYAVVQDGGLRTVVREEFDKAMVLEARRMGINVAENEPLVAFSHNNDAMAVQTTKRNLTTQILVGADGAKSMVRRGLYRHMGKGGKPRTACSTLNAIIQVEESTSPEHRHLEGIIDLASTFRRGIPGYVWSFPLISQGQTFLNVGVGGFRLSKDPAHSLRQILLEFLAEKGVSLEKSQLESHPIRWFHPESMLSANRVLLVGDAAGIDPLWGEGISFSLGYGAVAADCIARALESKDFSFTMYKEDLLGHEVGQELLNRLELANKLYRSERIGSLRAHILSVMWPQ